MELALASLDSNDYENTHDFCDAGSAERSEPRFRRSRDDHPKQGAGGAWSAAGEARDPKWCCCTKIDEKALKRYCRKMPEYSGFLRGFFSNHENEEPTHNFLRYLSDVRLMFQVEEDAYTASVKDAAKLFEAYDAITGRNGRK